jgi:outer membrane protein OmpA-like peptidoglycan-associated protein
MKTVGSRSGEREGGRKMRSVKRTVFTALLGTAIVMSMTPAAVLATAGQNNHSQPWLRMGIGARGLAMGGAFTAVTSDLTSVYWNPAGLAHVGRLEFTAFYSGGMEEDRNFNYFGYAQHLYHNDADWGSIGFGWLNSSMENFRDFDPSGQELGLFDYNNNDFYLGWGRQFGERLGLGITGKFLHNKVNDSQQLSSGEGNNMGGGFDIGGYYDITDKACLAVVWQDVVSRIGAKNAVENTDEVPWNVRVGVGIKPVDHLVGAIDMEKARNQEYILHLGGEYTFELSEDYSTSLRMGVDDGHFAGGFGFGLKWLELGYAFVDEGEDFLGNNHRLSVSLKLPGPAEVDTDGDGIMDKYDECPRQPEDYDGYMDGDGCPDPDNDNDGILDVNDKCPNNAETFNNYMDDDGCPDEATPEIPKFINIIFQFATAKIVGADHVPVMDYIASVMKDHPEMRLKITGYTDNIGSEAFNMKLSEKRATGVDAERFDLDWKGESNPIDTNDTEEGRQRNRRIEFTVLD